MGSIPLTCCRDIPNKDSLDDSSPFLNKVSYDFNPILDDLYKNSFLHMKKK